MGPGRPSPLRRLREQPSGPAAGAVGGGEGAACLVPGCTHSWACVVDWALGRTDRKEGHPVWGAAGLCRVPLRALGTGTGLGTCGLRFQEAESDGAEVRRQPPAEPLRGRRHSGAQPDPDPWVPGGRPRRCPPPRSARPVCGPGGDVWTCAGRSLRALTPSAPAGHAGGRPVQGHHHQDHRRGQPEPPGPRPGGRLAQGPRHLRGQEGPHPVLRG